MLIWMAYSTLVGALLALAAMLLEQNAHALTRYKRFVWLSGMVGTVLLTASSLVPRATNQATAPTSSGTVDIMLLLVWLGGAVLCLSVLVASAARVAYMQRRWREDVVAGVPV